jgi:hypothetical protein
MAAIQEVDREELQKRIEDVIEVFQRQHGRLPRKVQVLAKSDSVPDREYDLSAREDLDMVADVVTSQRPDLSRAAVISKALDLHPEWYHPDMPPARDPEPIEKQEMPAGIAKLVDELVRVHPQLTREQALLHVLNQDPELYELRWPVR